MTHEILPTSRIGTVAFAWRVWKALMCERISCYTPFFTLRTFVRFFIFLTSSEMLRGKVHWHSSAILRFKIFYVAYLTLAFKHLDELLKCRIINLWNIWSRRECFVRLLNLTLETSLIGLLYSILYSLPYYFSL